MLVERNVSKYPQSDRPFAAPGPFVFFPLQLLDDTVVALQRFPTLDVLEKAAATARDRGKYLVLKRHPGCTNECVANAIARVSKDNEYVLRTDASIHAILQACDAVLVANSGVGFEALIHHRPVYTFAGSEFELVTQKLATLGDIAAAFASSHEADFDLVDRYLTYFLRQNCFSPEDIGGILRHLDVAMEEVEAGAVADAESGKDTLQLKLLETSARLERARRRIIALEAKLAGSWLLHGRVSPLARAVWRRIVPRRVSAKP
jgi:CDP-glycerol glycerophosphotransferase (TagB/SpsB family)